MIIKSVQEALDRLADISWWFQGFSAARPPAIDEGPGEHRELRDGANEIRKFIYRLVSGRDRRIAFGEHERILISLAELEAMRDGLWPLTDNDEDNRVVLKQREIGHAVADMITREYAVEERSARDPNVPF